MSGSRRKQHRQKRIALWCIPVADLGGVARHVLDATRTSAPGWQIVVFCPEGPLAERLREQGAAVTTGKFGREAGLCASVVALASLVRRLRPDIVHSHLAYADIVVALTPMPIGTRRITTEHGIAGEDAVYHKSEFIARCMAFVHSARLRRFNAIIAVSEATRGAMIAKWKPRRQIDVVLNGVDAPPSARQAPTGRSDRLRILSLSRLAPEKRIDVLIDAFARVRVDRPEATLVIAGVGPLEGELRAQVARLGLQDAVSFPGYIEAAAAMADADVIAQLSVWENCSYTLLDASARGLPVVATDVGGNREVVANGVLVPFDTVGADTVSSALLDAPRERDVPIASVGDMMGGLVAVYDRCVVSAESGRSRRLHGGE